MKKIIIPILLFLVFNSQLFAATVSVCNMPSTSTVQVRIYDITDAVEDVAWTATGVSEREVGLSKSCYYYSASLEAGHSYQIDWRDSATPTKVASEALYELNTYADATTTSRLAQGPVTLTAAYDASKTAAQASTALSNTTWTDLKAGYIDATISSKASQTSVDNIDTSAESEARFTEIKGVGWTNETLIAIKTAISGGLEPQTIRDAMKLAPGSGNPADGSIDKRLVDIQAETASHPTLSEIEASSVLAKDNTVAKDATVAKDSTVAKESTLLRGLGLMMENHVEDDIVRNAKGLKTSSKFYLYTTKAHAQTHDKITGVIATYGVSITYDSLGNMTRFKVVKD